MDLFIGPIQNSPTSGDDSLPSQPPSITLGTPATHSHHQPPLGQNPLYDTSLHLYRPDIYSVKPSRIAMWSNAVDVGDSMHAVDEFTDLTQPEVSVMGGAPEDPVLPFPRLQPQQPSPPMVGSRYPQRQHVRQFVQGSYASSIASSSPPASTNPAHSHPSSSSQTRPTSVSGHLSWVAEQEPADAPWNLVPYTPFAGGAQNGGSGNSGAPGGNNVAGMFLRSPTPTKRQRTNQACEKCRDRKAKCNGARPTCLRCQNRGLPCEYAKERRMRGPNKGQAGHQAGSASPRQASLASAPYRSGPEPNSVDGSTRHNPPLISQPSPVGQRRRVATSGDPQLAPFNAGIHTNHSQPDLPYLSNSSGALPSADSPTSSRRRAHTTSYLPNYASHPYHLSVTHEYHQPSPSASTEQSYSSTSEPPSATESTFGADLHQALYVSDGSSLFNGPHYHLNQAGVGGLTVGLGAIGFSEPVSHEELLKFDEGEGFPSAASSHDTGYPAGSSSELDHPEASRLELMWPPTMDYSVDFTLMGPTGTEGDQLSRNRMVSVGNLRSGLMDPHPDVVGPGGGLFNQEGRPSSSKGHHGNPTWTSGGDGERDERRSSYQSSAVSPPVSTPSQLKVPVGLPLNPPISSSSHDTFGKSDIRAYTWCYDDRATDGVTEPRSPDGSATETILQSRAVSRNEFEIRTSDL